MKRCKWVTSDPDYIQYHDTEWGVPVYEDRKLFEFLVLESAQAGLSWLTILKRRQGYRNAFAGFDAQKVAGYTGNDIEMLVQDKRIIRNRRKIEAAVNNAKAFLNIQEQFGSFSDYAWGFVDGTPIVNTFVAHEEIPAYTDLAVKFSKDLKQRGFTFLGPTIIYSHMQATGMVNDHLVSCFRYREVIASQSQ